MPKINEIRNELLSASDPEETQQILRSQIQETIKLFNERFSNSDGELEVREIINALGINMSTSDSILNQIEKDYNRTVTFVTNSSYTHKQETIALTRLLGIYLFTDALNNRRYFEDEVLTVNEEEAITDFTVLMSIPNLTLDTMLSISDLIELSFSTGIPLPQLRATLSL